MEILSDGELRTRLYEHHYRVSEVMRPLMETAPRSLVQTELLRTCTSVLWLVVHNI